MPLQKLAKLKGYRCGKRGKIYPPTPAGKKKAIKQCVAIAYSKAKQSGQPVDVPKEIVPSQIVLSKIVGQPDVVASGGRVITYGFNVGKGGRIPVRPALVGGPSSLPPWIKQGIEYKDWIKKQGGRVF